VEQFIAEFEVAAEEDASLNRHSKPAINKLVKLPLLIDVLSKYVVEDTNICLWFEFILLLLIADNNNYFSYSPFFILQEESSAGIS
jgi:hypothetical protein